MTTPTPTTPADLVTAPIQLFIAGAWAETFRAPDDRGNIVTYIRADVHEAALAAERALRVAAEARVAVLEDGLTRIKNYCAHSPQTQAELNCAAWARAALEPGK